MPFFFQVSNYMQLGYSLHFTGVPKQRLYINTAKKEKSMKQLISPIFIKTNPIKICIPNKLCVLWRIKKASPPQRSGTAHLPQETGEALNCKIFSSSSSDRLYITTTKSKLIHTTNVSWQAFTRAPGSPRTSCTPAQDKLLAWFTRVFYLVNSWMPCRTMLPWTLLPSTPIVPLTSLLESIPCLPLGHYFLIDKSWSPQIIPPPLLMFALKYLAALFPHAGCVQHAPEASAQSLCSPIVSSFLSPLWTFSIYSFHCTALNDWSNPYK